MSSRNVVWSSAFRWSRITTPQNRLKAALQTAPGACAAFTLVEVQIALATLIVAIGAAIATHYFGLCMFQRASLKLSASDEARIIIGKIGEEIRSCTTVVVGTGRHETFTEIPDDQPQMGNALRIFPGTNLTDYVTYYRDDDETLKKWSTRAQVPDVLGRFVTNALVFTAQDWAGNVLTNNENNRVIAIKLQFLHENVDGTKHQGKGALHEYYHLETKVTRRRVL